MNDFLDQYVLYPHHFSPASLALLVLVLVAILAFELWMLVDVLTNRKVPVRHKVWWVILMFLIHPFTAIVYFFTRSAYKKSKR
jgi:hypothetical protein